MRCFSPLASVGLAQLPRGDAAPPAHMPVRLVVSPTVRAQRDEEKAKAKASKLEVTPGPGAYETAKSTLDGTKGAVAAFNSEVERMAKPKKMLPATPPEVGPGIPYTI